MEIIYNNKHVEKQCTSLQAAVKLFGGDKDLAMALHARVASIAAAEVIKDIIVVPKNHFHKLNGRLDGLFAVDVKTRREKWRIILCPLNDNLEEFQPCHIDEIADVATAVKIMEVSAHYE